MLVHTYVCGASSWIATVKYEPEMRTSDHYPAAEAALHLNPIRLPIGSPRIVRTARLYIYLPPKNIDVQTVKVSCR